MLQPDPDFCNADRRRVLAELVTARRWLIRSYLLHVVWFGAMCLFVAFGWKQRGLTVTVLLTLITVPPVLWATVRVHVLCRRIDPRAATVGWVPVIVTTLVLSPFESGLVLPAKNLWVATRLLRMARTSSNAGSAADRTGYRRHEQHRHR